MRLLIRLLCSENSKYHDLHDKEGYKLFCFSNIFPAYDLKQGDLHTLIISSPDSFVKYLSTMASEAQRLYDELKNAGSNPSLDNKNIRVREDWSLLHRERTKE